MTDAALAARHGVGEPTAAEQRGVGQAIVQLSGNTAPRHEPRPRARSGVSRFRQPKRSPPSGAHTFHAHRSPAHWGVVVVGQLLAWHPPTSARWFAPSAIGHTGRVSLTFPVAPMKAALGTLPGDDERWAYEIKWDGYRTLAAVDDGSVRLQSSNLYDVTAKYPELSGLPDGVHAESAILDGELVVLDDQGRPRFELLQVHTRQAALVVFDVLQVDGHDTIGLPYEDRRRLLDQLVEQGANWLVSAHQIGDGRRCSMPPSSRSSRA